MNKYYFAYGSNLNGKYLEERGFPVLGMKRITAALLPDRELAFTRLSKNWRGGVLDVRPRLGAAVPGVIFEIGDDLVRELDAKEGCPHAYSKKELMAILPDGRLRNVFTYEVNPETRQSFVPPTREYLAVVRKGYVAHGLSEKSLDAAVSDTSHGSSIDGLFVYGTLMRGEIRHANATSPDLECTLLAETYGTLRNLGTYPGMTLEANPRSMVQGEFFRYRRGCCPLSTLDEVEGFRGFDSQKSLYFRTIISVGMIDGRVRQAWTYIYSGNGGVPIISGDWRLHCGRKKVFIDALVKAHLRVRREDEIQIALGKSYETSEVGGLAGLLMTGAISERKLAQVSGEWRALAAS